MSVLRSSSPAALVPDASFPFGLGRSGLHELSEARYGDFPALTGLALAALRDAARPGACLWVTQRSLTAEHGRMSGRGLARAGVNPGRLLLVEAATRMDALKAVEEGARDGRLAGVIAELDDMDFTAARRLVLASQDSQTPLILLFPHTRSGATAAHGRWRVSARLSQSHNADPRAPGRPAWRAELEKSRLQPGEAGRIFDLEFRDEAPCLRLVPGLATRSSAPQPRRGASIRPGNAVIPWRRAG
ncbi:ImuA family protein [Maricaulis parjimensis]|uniref:ImuA family protein n=1 Tax=Maricaulis parjimensis TaxID=144023 RepID=UPI00193930D0|nr:hypothetical protein [Maricaulis parjimensis]